WAELERNQKNAYRQQVRDFLASSPITFIGEEEQEGKALFAAGLGVEHEPIDMPLVERERLGIPKGYACDPAIIEADKQRFHRTRERYMFDRCVRAETAHREILVICGMEHIAGLQHLFREGGHDVVQVRTVREWLAEEQTWYE